MNTYRNIDIKSLLFFLGLLILQGVLMVVSVRYSVASVATSSSYTLQRNVMDASGSMTSTNYGMGLVAGENSSSSQVSSTSYALRSGYLFKSEPQTPGTLQFSASTYSISEGGGTVTITVTRTGGSDGAASVNYATTAGGSATAGSDYTAISATALNWTDADSANKTFTVTIIDDSSVEGDETVNLTLSGASGAALGSQTTATLTINDDDVAPAPTPPSTPTSPSTPTPPTDPTPDSNPLVEAVDQTNDALDQADSTDSDVAAAVEEAVQQANDTLELATDMVEQGTATPGEALIALTVVDDAFTLLGESVGEGVDVDTGGVVETLQLASEISTLALESTATTPAQLDSIVSSTDDILESLPSIIASVDNGLEIVAQVDELVETGLTAGLSAAGTDTAALTGFIDGISDVITALALDTTITGNTNVVGTAVDIISKAVNAIQGSGNQSGAAIVAQLQNETSDIIDAIRNNMMKNDQPFSDFNQGTPGQRIRQASPSETADGGTDAVTPEKINALTKEVSNIIKPFVENSTALNETLMRSIIEVLDGAFDSIIDQLAQAWGIDTTRASLADNGSALKTAISQNPALLKDILEIASVDISNLMDRTTVADWISSSSEGDFSGNALLIEKALPVIIVLDNSVLKKDEVSPIDSFNSVFVSALGEYAVSLSSSQPGMMKLTIKGVDNLNYDYSVFVTSIDAVSSKLPEGIYLLPDGKLVTISGNIAITSAPLFSDSFTLINEMLNWGMNFKILDDCRWMVDLGDDAPVITGMTGYGELRVADKSEGEDPVVAFSLQGEEPSAHDYAFQLIYQGALVQAMPPALHGVEQLTNLLEYFKIKYLINRDTGVVTIFDAWHYKPDYVMNRLTPDDLKYWKENKDDHGLAWKGGDFNQDGLADFEMFTSEGRQVLYQLKP